MLYDLADTVIVVLKVMASATIEVPTTEKIKGIMLVVVNLNKNGKKIVKHVSSYFIQNQMLKDSLMLFEMAFNRNAGKYVSTDRLVIITDDGIQDTGDIIF